MLYVGLDVHSKQSSLCILNSAGGTVNQIQLKGPRSAVVDRLRQLDQPFSICYEASCGYGHLYEQLRPIAAHVAVAHPGKLRLIYRSKRKNDKVDAQKLAKLLLLDMVPPVHVPDIDVRAWRSLIVLRQRVLAQVVRAKNQIRGVLRENDIAGAKWLWSKKQLAWLGALDLHPVAKLRLELAVEEFRSLDQKIKRLEKELQKYADTHPAVKLLMTIPGVGIRTAETFVAWVDDVTRFRNNRQLGAYFGLVPCQDASADKNRLGHITRDGPPVMRKLICEATWTAIKKCPRFKRFFEQVQGGKNERKKIALVATMHRMIKVMGAMLRSGEAYEASYGELKPEQRPPHRGGRSGENPIRPPFGSEPQGRRQAVLSAPAPHLSPASPASLGGVDRTGDIGAMGEQ
jgi:transposase